MLVPYYKRITDAVNELRIWFEFYSCGKNQTLILTLIEMVVDPWCPQIMNDFDTLLETYKDEPIAFGVPETSLAMTVTEFESQIMG